MDRQHGWVYLHAIVDCCTRELVGWSLDLRCRDEEAITVVDAAVLARRVEPGQLTLGSDNGSQFTSRDFRKHLSTRGIVDRRGGYRDPESQAFIESWFGRSPSAAPGGPSRSPSIKLERRSASTSTATTSGRTPASGHRTPAEVATTRQDPQALHTPAT